MMGRFFLFAWIAWMTAGNIAIAAESPGGASGEAVSQRQLLKQILNRPVYQRWKQRQEPEARLGEESYIAQMARSTLESIWEGVKSVFKWLKSLLDKARWSIPSISGEPASVIDFLKQGAWLAFGVMLLMGGLYLYGARKKLAGGMNLARILSRERIRQALDDAEALALDSQEWMAVADRMEEEGDFRAMFRAVYLALLSGLHQRGAIDFRKNRTNWTYVRGFKGAAGEKEEFGGLTDLFDQVWYGLKSPEGVSIPQVRARASALLEIKAAA